MFVRGIDFYFYVRRIAFAPVARDNNIITLVSACTFISWPPNKSYGFIKLKLKPTIFLLLILFLI